MNQQVKAYLISYLRLFAAAVIAAYLALAKAPLDLDWGDTKVLLNAGIGALIVSVGNALNPRDNRYGIGAPAAKELSAGDVATNAAATTNVRVVDDGASSLEVACWITAAGIVLIVLFGTGLVR